MFAPRASTQPPCQFRQLRLAAGHEQDIHAALGKLLGEGGAQALGGAGNQDPLPVAACEIAHPLVPGRPPDGAQTFRRLNPGTTPYKIAIMGRTVTHRRPRLVEGEVRMRQHHALLGEELAAGFVLTCQWLPVSARVVLDYELPPS